MLKTEVRLKRKLRFLDSLKGQFQRAHPKSYEKSLTKRRIERLFCRTKLSNVNLVLDKRWRDLIRIEWPKRSDPWYRQSIKEKIFLIRMEEK